MEQIKQNRYTEVDIVKGIAILFVMLGHSYCQHPINLDATTNVEIRNFFMHCQMPLFFLASGFLFSTKDDWALFAKKKVMRLLVPFIIFSIASQCLRYFASGFSHSGEAPGFVDAIIKIATGQTYWFLYSLLLVMIIARFITNKFGRLVLVVMAVISNLFLGADAIPLFTIDRTTRFCIWFFLGIVLRREYHILVPILKQLWLLLASLLSYSILCLYDLNRMLLAYVAPFLGCCLFWNVSLQLAEQSEDTILNKVLTHFGMYSLQYYLNHLLIMLGCYIFASKLPTSIPTIQLISIFSMAVVISWLMLQVEMRIPLLRKLCGL